MKNEDKRVARKTAERLIMSVSAVDAHDADLSLSAKSSSLFGTAATAWMIHSNPHVVSDDRLKSVLKRQRVTLFAGESEATMRLVYLWINS